MAQYVTFNLKCSLKVTHPLKSPNSRGLSAIAELPVTLRVVLWTNQTSHQLSSVRDIFCILSADPERRRASRGWWSRETSGIGAEFVGIPQGRKLCGFPWVWKRSLRDFYRMEQKCAGFPRECSSIWLLFVNVQRQKFVFELLKDVCSDLAYADFILYIYYQ